MYKNTQIKNLIEKQIITEEELNSLNEEQQAWILDDVVLDLFNSACIDFMQFKKLNYANLLALKDRNIKKLIKDNEITIDEFLTMQPCHIAALSDNDIKTLWIAKKIDTEGLISLKQKKIECLKKPAIKNLVLSDKISIQDLAYLSDNKLDILMSDYTVTDLIKGGIIDIFDLAILSNDKALTEKQLQCLQYKCFSDLIKNNIVVFSEVFELGDKQCELLKQSAICDLVKNFVITLKEVPEKLITDQQKSRLLNAEIQQILLKMIITLDQFLDLDFSLEHLYPIKCNPKFLEAILQERVDLIKFLKCKPNIISLISNANILKAIQAGSIMDEDLFELDLDSEQVDTLNQCIAKKDIWQLILNRKLGLEQAAKLNRVQFANLANSKVISLFARDIISLDQIAKLQPEHLNAFNKGILIHLVINKSLTIFDVLICNQAQLDVINTSKFAMLLVSETMKIAEFLALKDTDREFIALSAWVKQENAIKSADDDGGCPLNIKINYYICMQKYLAWLKQVQLSYGINIDPLTASMLSNLIASIEQNFHLIDQEQVNRKRTVARRHA